MAPLRTGLNATGVYPDDVDGGRGLGGLRLQNLSGAQILSYFNLDGLTLNLLPQQ
jgi:hypothetical protein